MLGLALLQVWPGQENPLLSGPLIALGRLKTGIVASKVQMPSAHILPGVGLCQEGGITFGNLSPASWTLLSPLRHSAVLSHLSCLQGRMDTASPLPMGSMNRHAAWLVKRTVSVQEMRSAVSLPAATPACIPAEVVAFGQPHWHCGGGGGGGRRCGLLVGCLPTLSSSEGSHPLTGGGLPLEWVAARTNLPPFSGGSSAWSLQQPNPTPQPPVKMDKEGSSTAGFIIELVKCSL